LKIGLASRPIWRRQGAAELFGGQLGGDEIAAHRRETSASTMMDAGAVDLGPFDAPFLNVTPSIVKKDCDCR
jgi:hypothetical protein